MHLLDIDLMTVQLPTQIVGECFNTHFNHSTQPTGVAMVSVEIDGEDHVCTVAAPLTFGTSAEVDGELHAEWLELMQNSEKVLRTVSLTAVPADDVLGAVNFAIKLIDLRTEEGVNRFFAEVIK